MICRIRSAGLFMVLSAVLSIGDVYAADKVAAIVSVQDGLTVPNQSVSIATKLMTKGVLNQGLGGEPLELLINGQVVATAMTGGDGKAIFSYTPKAQGTVRIHVRVGTSPRVAPVEGEGNLFVWERRNPILAVEMAALVEAPPSQIRLPGFDLLAGSAAVPMPDAASELGKLTQFYYHVIYVVPTGGDGFHASVQARD